MNTKHLFMIHTLLSLRTHFSTFSSNYHKILKKCVFVTTYIVICSTPQWCVTRRKRVNGHNLFTCSITYEDIQDGERHTRWWCGYFMEPAKIYLDLYVQRITVLCPDNEYNNHKSEHTLLNILKTHTDTHAYIHTCIYTHMHIYIHIYLPIYPASNT